jgi:ATP-dependent Lon protease
MKIKKGVLLKNENDIKINTTNQNFLEIFTIIKEKIEYIQEIIRKTILSVEKYKKCDIFSNSDMNVCVYTLNGLYEKTMYIIEKNQTYMHKHTEEEYNYSDENVNEMIELIQQTTDRLCAILANFGTDSLEDLLYISFGQDFRNNKYDKENPLFIAKYTLLKKYMHPTGYKIVHWKTGTLNHSQNHAETHYCSNKMTDDIVVYEHSNHLECFDIDMTIKNVFYKINGIRTVIHNEKLRRTIIITGILDDISHDLLCNEYIQCRKTHIFNNIPSNIEMEDIITRMVETMTLKDMLILGASDVYKKYMTLANDVNTIKYVKLNITIKNFLEMDIFAQRSMLMNLLIYNKEDDVQYITYLLYDLLNVHSNENMDSYEQKTIFDSFPWKIKNYFKDTMKMTMKYTQDMLSKYDINRISLEQQIYLLKAPENVKEKAIIKLKEIKNKNDDASVKSKQYLEGLLKIPFGIYRQEPILKMIKDFHRIFRDILTKNSVYLKDLEYVQKESYTNIEMIKIMEKIEKYIHAIFVKDIQSKIDQSNTKQLSNIIQYIQNVYKTNNQLDVRMFTNANKTKFEKIQSLNAFWASNANYMNSNIKTDIIIPFYKIYELCQGSPMDQNISKLPMEIKTLTKNIKDIGSSLNKVSQILDDSIYGHFHAKNQILKIIGQWMTGEQTGYCFGFEGSPGIGKTSLAKKGLSHCLKDENGESRPFSFIALGGSCNGSTLEGHSYTYVNSTWGRIVDILMETKCMNPIIYVDELDKVSKTEHGKEIIGILTHLIDTTQNDVFQDKYYSGIDIDLSKALFIFSYNDPEQIDRILLDRIHRIHFDNLSIEDKKVIVDKYILPEINKKMGFSNVIEISEQMIEYIIENYTLEPGVRKLKELLFDLYGEINIQLLKGEGEIEDLPIRLTKENLDKYLKKYHKIEEAKIISMSKVGIINGLWANALGKGGVLAIEAVFFPSSSFLELRLTGLQGDVMKESMNVAKTLAWTLTDDTVKTQLLKTFDKTKCQGLHIHCPDGAVSKDGPSAGTAITTAIYSLLNHKKIKNHIAITGEINLQGNITAIGGLETKILGGIRAGVTMFLFPDANLSEYTEFKKKYGNKMNLDNIQFINVGDIKKVFEYVFE